MAAHECFEAGWRVTRGDERRVLQVLVLWAAAIVQHERGHGGGARRLLARALERVAQISEDFALLDLDSLKTSVIESWGQIVSGEQVVPTWPQAPEAGPERIELEHRASCPSCGEPVLVAIAPEDADGSTSIEDCPVCCRPWQVQVQREGANVRVSLSRQDA